MSLPHVSQFENLWSKGSNKCENLLPSVSSSLVCRPPRLSLSTGLGRSKSAEAPTPVGEPAPAGFLKEVCEQLSLSPVVVISPSLSGMYSLPFLLQHQALIRAYIPVAPICTEKFTAEQYQSVKVYSLCVRLYFIFLCSFSFPAKPFFTVYLLFISSLKGKLDQPWMSSLFSSTTFSPFYMPPWEEQISCDFHSGFHPAPDNLKNIS